MHERIDLLVGIIVYFGQSFDIRLDLFHFEPLAAKGKDVAVTLNITYHFESNGVKITKTPTKPRCSLSESARGVVRMVCSSNGAKNREHAC